MHAEGYAYNSVIEPSAEINTKAGELIESAAAETAWTALSVEEEQTATQSAECMEQSGFNTVIDTDLQLAWESFRDANLALLYRAGGAVNAQVTQ